MSPEAAQYIESLEENGLLAIEDDEMELYNVRVCK